jgi:adenylate kinase
MATRKTSSALSWITSEAKKMKKKQPGAKWANLVKKAGAAYRAKKKPAARKKVAKKKAAKKKVARKAVRRPGSVKVVTTNSVKRTVGTVSGIMAQGKRMLIDKIGKLESKKFEAKGVMAKRKIQKEITATKAQARKFM